MNPLTGILAILAMLALPASAQIGNIVVTNAASFEVGMPDRGSLGTIFCTGLVVDSVVRADHLPLPKTLAGVTVTVGGASAPLLVVASLGGYQQINFQAPEATVGNPDATVPVVVTQNGISGSALAPFSPIFPGAFFRIFKDGNPYGIFQHASDYSLVTTDNPATPGELIIAYLTGLPTATPIVPDGEPAPASPLSVVPQPETKYMIQRFSVYVGGPLNPLNLSGFVPSPISFIGLSPGSVGLYQINFTVAQGTRSGVQAVQVVRTFCTSFRNDCDQLPLSNTISLPVGLPVR